MLVLTRKPGQSIDLDGGISITVVRANDKAVRIGVTAPREIKVMRRELVDGSPRKPKQGGPRR